MAHMSRGGDNRYYDNGNRHDSYRQNDRHRQQYNSNEDRYHNHSNRYEKLK
uniref:Uncharacterized protein n=1 Tax=Caenorhabditis japonica TaxID=281687 RepID=A0A8R1IJS3_CAEJA